MQISWRNADHGLSFARRPKPNMGPAEAVTVALCMFKDSILCAWKRENRKLATTVDSIIIVTAQITQPANCTVAYDKMPQLGSRKSRLGCRQCKQRRVKCDECIPCGACLRRNDECSLTATSLGEGSTTASGSTAAFFSQDWISDLFVSSSRCLGVDIDK